MDFLEILIRVSNIKLHENLSSGNQVDTCRQRDGKTC